MRIINVSRTEFKTEDGKVFPIIPPLEEDLTIEEFQKHYDNAIKAIKSCEGIGSVHKDTEKLG